MSFETDFNKFVNNHPYLSVFTFGLVPVVWTGVGRIFSWIKNLIGIPKDVDDVAKESLSKTIEVVQFPDLHGRVSPGLPPSERRSAWQPPRALVPPSSRVHDGQPPRIEGEDDEEKFVGPRRTVPTPQQSSLGMPVPQSAPRVLNRPAMPTPRSTSPTSRPPMPAPLPSRTTDDGWVPPPPRSPPPPPPPPSMPPPPLLDNSNMPIGVVQEIERDGNCLYASFAAAFLGNTDKLDDVRLRISQVEADILDEYYDLSLDPQKLNQTLDEINDSLQSLNQMIRTKTLIDSGLINDEPLMDDETFQQTENSILELERKKAALETVMAITTSFGVEKEAKIQQVDEQIASLQQAHEAGLITPEQLNSELSRAKEEKKALENQKFDPQEYVNQTATERVFGKSAEIMALSMAYPVSIYIYTYDPLGKIVPMTDEPYGNGPNPVHLMNQGDHFEPIVHYNG